MTVWHYYVKMIRYEQLFVPAAMMGVCLLLITLLKGNPSRDPSSSVVLAFIEAALPLATAIIANGLFLDDPALELHYTVPRPLWRTLLEKLALLIGVMTVFYLLFAGLVYILGVPLVGWGLLPPGILLWIVPAIAWSGLAFFIGALLRSGVAGNALAALAWIVCFLLHDLMLSRPNWRAVYPFMTIFMPDSPDWLLNRAGLLMIGLVGIGSALILLRKGERYFKSEL